MYNRSCAALPRARLDLCWDSVCESLQSYAVFPLYAGSDDGVVDVISIGERLNVAVISALPAIDVLTIHIVLDGCFGYAVLLSVESI